MATNTPDPMRAPVPGRWRPGRLVLLPVDLLVLSFDVLRILAWYLPARLFSLFGLCAPPAKRSFLPCMQADGVSVGSEVMQRCSPSRKYANPFVFRLLCSGAHPAVAEGVGGCLLCRRHGRLGVTGLRLLGATALLGLCWGVLGGGGWWLRSRLGRGAAVAQASAEPALAGAVPVVGRVSADPWSDGADTDALSPSGAGELYVADRDPLASATPVAPVAAKPAPDSLEGQLQTAAAALGAGHWEAAEQVYRKILAATPAQTEAGIGLARALRARGEVKAALAQAQAVALAAPKDVGAGAELAEALLANGERLAALELYEKLGRDHPAYTGVRARYVDLLMRAGRRNDALTAARQLAADQPGAAGPQIVLGDLYLRLNLPDAALECCQAALRESPQAAMGRLLLARISMAKGDTAVATREVSALLQLNPDSLDLSLALGKCHEAAGKVAEATAVYERAAEAHAAAPDPWVRLARLQAQDGHSDQAIASYRQALQRAPENPLLLGGLAALLVEQPAGLDEAYALATQAHRLAPSRPLLADTLGWACHLRQDDARAVELLAAARGAMPRHALVRYHYAAVLAALGRPAEAARELTPVLGLAKFRHLAAAQKLNEDLQARLSTAPVTPAP